MSNFRARVISKLAEMTVMHEVIIDGGTERYGDLRIQGEDLWQFLDWVALQFGTDFSDMNASLYQPPEGWELFAGKYRSLTAGSVLAAIESGRWRD